MCLSHTTGLPNWRWFEPDRKLRVKFEPGTRYSYSGEGLTLLQVVLEQLTKRSLEDWMRGEDLRALRHDDVELHLAAAVRGDYCHGHDEAGKVQEKDKDNAARSASTLETTLGDYARFLRAVLSGARTEARLAEGDVRARRSGSAPSGSSALWRTKTSRQRRPRARLRPGLGRAADARTGVGRLQGGPQQRRLRALLDRVPGPRDRRADHEQQRQRREHLQGAAGADHRRQLHAVGVAGLRAIRL